MQNAIGGKMVGTYEHSCKKSGLLGRKLGHSFSPLIHSYLADYSYELFEKEPEHVEDFMRNGDFDAINVTIPYKKDAFAICDEVSEIASKIGSVNTVVKKNGYLKGYNTDYYGFSYLVKKAGFDKELSSGKSLVLGSGGSAVTVCAVLKDMGAKEVIVISRSGPDNYDNVYDNHSDALFIVNTTPLGMYPKNGEAAVDLEKFTCCRGVIDIIFNPAKTKLLLDAQSLGIPFINGLPMLVAQAKQASEFFTGRSIADDVIDPITRRIESDTKNIILIGMPGCGKTTVGSLIADKLLRPFVDIDLEIQSRIGMCICDYFKEYGEASFRKIETEMLGEFARKSGLIIATGGGVIKNPANLPLMRQNGVIVMLNRPLCDLPVDGRPISMSCSLEKLGKERLPIYNAWKDISVKAGKPEDTANEIIKECIFND